MCQYCGGRSPETIDELTREHDAATTSRSSSRSALHVLREHIAKEEDGLFPAALTSLSGTDGDLVESVRDRVGSALRAPSRN